MRNIKMSIALVGAISIVISGCETTGSTGTAGTTSSKKAEVYEPINEVVEEYAPASTPEPDVNDPGESLQVVDEMVEEAIAEVNNAAEAIYDVAESNDTYAQSDDTPASDKEYKFIKGFDIKGTWCNIGTDTFGQINRNSVVVFEDGHCNVYSPMDTYAFYQEDDHYILQVTGLLGGDFTFDVYNVDKKHIDLIRGTNVIELEKK